nr:MAG TPA: hypothetical protein [Caudoviricetes sp.]
MHENIISSSDISRMVVMTSLATMVSSLGNR